MNAGVAARNNAHWCGVVCRSHGLAPRFGAEAWTCAARTPPGYPDGVTLVPRPDLQPLLAAIDATEGCSIKDSFAALDLSAHGFGILFDAQWIVRGALPGAAPVGWERVTDGRDLAVWEEAWRNGADGPRDLFRPVLLADPAVAVLAAREGSEIQAGAVLNAHAGVVGVSNVFTRPGGRLADPWPGVLNAAAARFPGRPLVGYEGGDALATALVHGFTAAGPLRVWLR